MDEKQALEPTNRSYSKMLDDALNYGKLAHSSGKFKVENAAEASMKILLGWEMGINAFASLMGLSVYDGNLTMSSALIAATLKRAGFDWVIVESTSERCEITLTKGGAPVHTESLTIQEAKRAGMNMQAVKGGESKEKWTWIRYAKDMLMHRVRCRLARYCAPDAFLGMAVYDPDELNVIDMEPAENSAFAEQANEHRAAAAAKEDLTKKAEARQEKYNAANGGAASAPAGNETIDPKTKLTPVATTKVVVTLPDGSTITDDVPWENITSDLRKGLTYPKGKASFDPTKVKLDFTRALYAAYKASATAAIGMLTDEQLALAGWRQDWHKVDAEKMQRDTAEMDAAVAALLANKKIAEYAGDLDAIGMAIAPYPTLLALGVGELIHSVVAVDDTIKSARAKLHAALAEVAKTKAAA